MTGELAWGLLAAVLAAGFFLRMKLRNYGELGRARKGLRLLTQRQLTGISDAADLPMWDHHQAVLKKHPSEYNQLNMEIQFELAYLAFLEQHVPEDSRIEVLKATAGYRKDTIWGFKVNHK
ncbi:hypothetical protein [Paenibacillus gansuensis]|uniref:Uncharacterized protein n=1 Tax=Paenibacillus gansuensis TaxID=306542 RepID=A0ABW5PAF5_9BACL